MPTVTSFHVSTVEPGHINQITAEYLALERARICRRLFVTRFGLLALVVAVVGFGFHWLSAGASWSSVGLCLVTPTWAWLAELRHNRRLTRSLEAIPAGQVVLPRREKVVKSS